MGTTHHRATGQQQKFVLPAVAFDDAQFSASRTPRNTKKIQAPMTVAQMATVQSVEETFEAAAPAVTVFAGMSAKLTTWRLAPDSWRQDDVL